MASGARGRRSRRPRRPAVVTAVALAAAAAVAAGVVMTRDDGDDLRRGSVEQAGPEVDVTARTPETYRIDYRVVGLGGGDEVVTSERLLVRRPFDSRLESFDEPTPPDDGEPATVQVSTLGLLSASGTNSQTAVLTRPPAPAASDLRLAEVADDAVAAGLLERRERRVVAGRPCQVVRSGELLSAGTVSAPAADEYADTCIDEAGLLLEELLVVDGEELLHRVALRVDEGVDADDDDFEAGPPTVPLERGGGAVREITSDSRTPGMFWEAAVPPGYERRGRYIVVAPQPEGQDDPVAAQRRLTYVSDVFVDGADAVIVEQGSRLDRSAPFEIPAGVREVDLGPLGDGVVLLGANGSTVAVRRADGGFVRVTGTAGVRELVAVARRLSEVAGGRLTPVEPQPSPTAG